MKLFNKSFMNGANLLGVGLAILGISFALKFTGTKMLIFAIFGYVYLISSALAFFFPNLSE